MYVIKRTGEREEVSFDKCIKRIQKLSKDLKINPTEVAQLLIMQIYDGVETYKLDELAAEICAAKSTLHPDYGKLSSRIIISNHHKNTSPSYSEVIHQLWNNKDILGVQTPLINELLYKTVMANKEKINTTIDYEKDFNYDYFGFKTLERSYLMRVNGKLIERPQHMLMRVSLSIHKDDLKEALKAYKLMSEGYFTHATPTLFNMGSCREQASSCFLITIDDDSIDGIYKTLKDCAKISQHAGGIGVAFHKIRAKNSYIRGNNGKSNGIVPMLKVFNETARYVDQGSRRAGSIACFCADTEVLTINEGVKKIQDINIGDLVITHKNRVQPVIQFHKNVLGDRKIYKLEVENNKDIYVTGNHEFWAYYTTENKSTHNYITKNKTIGWNSINTLKTILDHNKLDNKLDNKLSVYNMCYIACPTTTNIEDTKNYKIDILDYENIILNNDIDLDNDLDIDVDIDNKIKNKEYFELQLLSDNNDIGDNDNDLIKHSKLFIITKNIDNTGEIKNIRDNHRDNQPINRIWNITEDFAKLIGIWLTDGNIVCKKTKQKCHRNPNINNNIIGINFRIHKNKINDNKQTDHPNDHPTDYNTVNNKNKIQYIVKIYKVIFGSDIVFNISIKKNITYLTIYSRIIGVMFMKLFGSYHTGKRLHNIVYSWPKNLVNSLIAGLLTTNEYITNKCNVLLSLSNETLNNQVYHLCKNNGISASIVNGMIGMLYCISLHLTGDIFNKINKLYINDSILKC